MQRVNVQMARQLVKLGYNGEYESYVDEKVGYVDKRAMAIYDFMAPAPRLDDVAYWLIKEHGIAVLPHPIDRLSTYWDCHLVFFKGDHEEWCHVEEETLDDALLKGLEIVLDRLSETDSEQQKVEKTFFDILDIYSRSKGS